MTLTSSGLTSDSHGIHTVKLIPSVANCRGGSKEEYSFYCFCLSSKEPKNIHFCFTLKKIHFLVLFLARNGRSM
jgi:hypothetical protein